MKTKKLSKGLFRKILVRICQVVLLVAVSGFCLLPIINTLHFSINAHMVVGPSWLQLIEAAMPLIIMGEVLWLNRRRVLDEHFTGLMTTVAIGMTSMMVYLTVSPLESTLMAHYLPAAIPSWNETTILQAYGNSWSFSILFLILIPVILRYLTLGKKHILARSYQPNR